MFLTHTDTATKVRYYTPSFGGLSFGVDYTPTQEEVDDGELNGQFIARKGGALRHGGAERGRGRR